MADHISKSGTDKHESISPATAPPGGLMKAKPVLTAWRCYSFEHYEI